MRLSSAVRMSGSRGSILVITTVIVAIFVGGGLTFSDVSASGQTYMLGSLMLKRMRKLTICDPATWASRTCASARATSASIARRRRLAAHRPAAPVRRPGGRAALVAHEEAVSFLNRGDLEAAQEAGFAFNPDLNGKSQDGVGYSQMTRRGRWRLTILLNFATPLFKMLPFPRE